MWSDLTFVASVASGGCVPSVELRQGNLTWQCTIRKRVGPVSLSVDKYN
jgi:hypothetical protein